MQVGSFFSTNFRFHHGFCFNEAKPMVKSEIGEIKSDQLVRPRLSHQAPLRSAYCWRNARRVGNLTMSRRPSFAVAWQSPCPPHSCRHRDHHHHHHHHHQHWQCIGRGQQNGQSSFRAHCEVLTHWTLIALVDPRWRYFTIKVWSQSTFNEGPPAHCFEKPEGSSW